MAIPLRGEPGCDDDVETHYPLNPLPVDEFLSREAPPLAWLVPGLVPARGVTLMVSPPNAGKTLLALDYAAQAAAAGRKVIFIEEEGSLRGLQERVRRAVNAAGLTDKSNLLEIDWHPQFSLLDSAKRQYLVALMEAKKAELVVFDSLAAVCPGSDENDPADMGLVSEALHWIHAETDSAVMALHHTTKETWKPGQTPNLASARGHGALMGRVDAALALVPLNAPLGVVRFELYCVKMREAERPMPRQIEVNMRGPAAVVQSVQLEGNPNRSPASKRLTDMMASVLPIVPMGEEAAVSSNWVADQIRGHKPTILQAIKELIFATRLRQLSDKRVYRVKVQDNSGLKGSNPRDGRGPSDPDRPVVRKAWYDED